MTDVVMIAEALEFGRQLAAEQMISLQTPTPGWAYKVQYAEGLMCVEPINGAPYVVQLPATLYRFNYAEGNGRAKLQARIEADLFFQQLKNGEGLKATA